jgi:putative spermidine/putrescine transport system permease protein
MTRRAVQRPGSALDAIPAVAGAGHAVHGGAVRLSVPLRPAAVVHARWKARLAGQLHEFFTTDNLWNTIGTTLKLALPATLLNVGVAMPVAYQMRNRSRFQKVATTLLVPLTLGTVLIAEGMLTYFGPRGWLSQAVQALALYDGPIRLTHNYWGVLISLVISGFPFAFLLTLSYITGIDPALPRAAATLGAPPWKQFRHIYLPLLLPGLAMAFCLSFVQAFSVFPVGGAAGGAGGATRVISIAAYEAAFEQYDYSLASAVAMVMGWCSWAWWPSC